MFTLVGIIHIYTGCINIVYSQILPFLIIALIFLDSHETLCHFKTIFLKLIPICSVVELCKCSVFTGHSCFLIGNFLYEFINKFICNIQLFLVSNFIYNQMTCHDIRRIVFKSISVFNYKLIMGATSYTNAGMMDAACCT